MPRGFHLAIGPATSAAIQGGSKVTLGAENTPWDANRVPLPTLADLQNLISKEGDLVADGSPSQQVALVQSASLVFSPLVRLGFHVSRSCFATSGRSEARIISVEFISARHLCTFPCGTIAARICGSIRVVPGVRSWQTRDAGSHRRQVLPDRLSMNLLSRDHGRAVASHSPANFINT